MQYEIKVRAPQYQSLAFEVWYEGVRVRVFKRCSDAEDYIARDQAVIACKKCFADPTSWNFQYCNTCLERQAPNV